MRFLWGVAVCLWLSACAATPTIPEPSTADTKNLWRLVAKADVVAVGTYEFPDAKMQAAIAAGKHESVDIPFALSKVLKGTVANPSVVVPHYTQDASYAPTNVQLKELSAKPVIVFLVRVKHSRRANELYMPNSGAEVVRVADQKAISMVMNEVQRQAMVLRNWKWETALPREAEMKQLLATVQTPETQRKAFRQLESVTWDAVPALVKLMGDRRPLPEPSISIVNKFPGAFEGLRHYHAQLMVDALAALLNDITGQSFGDLSDIDNTEEDRKRTVDGWRIAVDALKTGRLQAPPSGRLPTAQ